MRRYQRQQSVRRGVITSTPVPNKSFFPAINVERSLNRRRRPPGDKVRCRVQVGIRFAAIPDIAKRCQVTGFTQQLLISRAAAGCIAGVETVYRRYFTTQNRVVSRRRSSASLAFPAKWSADRWCLTPRSGDRIRAFGIAVQHRIQFQRRIFQTCHTEAHGLLMGMQTEIMYGRPCCCTSTGAN